MWGFHPLKGFGMRQIPHFSTETSGNPFFPTTATEGIFHQNHQNHENVNFEIFENKKCVNLSLLHSAQVKSIPGIEQYDVRLSSHKRVWDEKNSSFLCRDCRKITFSPLQPHRNFHQNHEKSWKSGFFRFLIFKNGQIYYRCIRRMSNQYQGSKGMVWGFHQPKGFESGKFPYFSVEASGNPNFPTTATRGFSTKILQNHEGVNFDDFLKFKNV